MRLVLFLVFSCFLAVSPRRALDYKCPSGFQFMSYEKAKAFIQAFQLKNQIAFREWSKSGNRPADFPSTPYRTYKDKWEGWGVFLGTGNVSLNKKQFMSYEEAKTFIQALQIIKSQTAFTEWSKSGKRPANFPGKPENTYKDKWEGWGAFLGTGNVNFNKKPFMPYEEAKIFIQAFQLKNQIAFREWSKSGKQPADFPATPHRTYKDKWENWGAFLGTGNVSSNKKPFMAYEEAKTFIQAFQLKNQSAFKEWSRLGKRPADFPGMPEKTYKDKWEGWGVFLGTGNISSHKKQFISYEEAKAFIQTFQLKNQSAFRKWSKSEKRPANFPAKPGNIYKDKWEGLAYFLGYAKPKKQMTYQQAKNYLKKTGIKTIPELKKFLQSEERPADFPEQPHIVYPEWKGPDNFLGIKWMSFAQARKLVRFAGLTDKSEYWNFIIDADMQDSLPPNPATAYRDNWQGWDHFFGY